MSMFGRPSSQPAGAQKRHMKEQPAGAQQKRHMKELLVTQLAKQLGALGDARLRAIIVAEVDRSLANNRKVSAEDVRRIEKDVRATVNITRIGALEAPKTMTEAALAEARINWGVIDEFKKVHGDEAERAKMQRAKDARSLLYSQIKHQISEKEAARRRQLAEEAEFVRKQQVELELREAEERRQAAERKARQMREMLDNREHVRVQERRRQEEAHVRQLEDERTLAEMRAAEQLAKAEKARQHVEKAKRLEFAKLAEERASRMKAEQRAKDDEEQRRLELVWTEILNEQERKREEGLRRMFEKQVIRAEAYGKSAGAELKEKAAKDEMNMLRWQTIYAQQQEERERRDQKRLADQEQDIQRSLKAQIELAAQRKRAEKAEDARRAATEAENTRLAKEVEARLRVERRLKDIAHQGELLVHARQVKQSRLDGELNADFMTDGDKMYNSHLVHAIVEHRRTGKLMNVTTPLG